MFNATRKALIWAIAVAIPLQGVPARSCSCTASRETVGASTCGHCSNERRAARCCCGRYAGHGCCCEHRPAKSRSCCCGNAQCECQHCTCSLDCPCREANQHPPTAPPIERRALEKVLCLDLASVSTIAVPTTKSHHPIVALASSDAMSGADRCISLCRFTL